MRKILAILLAFTLLLLSMAACEDPLSVQGTQDTATTPAVSEKTDAPTAAVSQPVHVRTTCDNTERAKLFLSYLSENYSHLCDLLFGGPAGIGFVDLDCDGGMEMILFDSGASAAMGVVFFDIIDGQVERVSEPTANDAVRDNAYLSTVAAVDANYADDFRLLQNQDGEKYFVLISSNGSLEFSYTEYVKFGADGEKLTLKSEAYSTFDYDTETGDTISSTYMVGMEKSNEAGYNKAVEKLTGNGVKDFGLDAVGVFAWEDSSYTKSADGLIAMANKALSISYDQIDLY